ncbi:histone-lysine N-methyltransferase MLL3 [Schistosoma bovis]|uniref:Histone-lysine N-methyltransferase MLL3 n=1 Tax=Schistosoma bovis TaxID=6184 RepID=A0A430QCR3_SCHBO|nr:histone-lysine N-methyltransferase MLL3 [Schistosoma bovis]
MTTVVDIYGSSNNSSTVSTNEVCQFSLISCSPNCDEDHLCNKNGLFISESVHDESFQRSPSSFKTPSKEVSSPGSFELPSMPSDKSSSRDCSDGHCSVNFLISSDLTDTDHSNSACSLSPCPQSVGHCSNANDECSILYSDRTLESAFYRSVRTDISLDNRANSHTLHPGFTDTQVSQDTSFKNSYSCNKTSAFTSFGCNNLDNAHSFQYINHNKSRGSDFQHLCETCISSDKITTSNSSPLKVCFSEAGHCFTEVIGCSAILGHSNTYPTSSTNCIRTSNSIVCFESQDLNSAYQSSQNMYNHLQRRKTACVSDASVPSSDGCELVYDRTEVQSSKVKNITVPSVYLLKEVDSSMFGIKHNIVRDKFFNDDYTCDPDPIIMGSGKISTTSSLGKRSLNVYSSPTDLENSIHSIEPKQLSPNYNYYLHKTPVISIAYPTNDRNKNAVLLQESMKNTDRKISSQNLDPRHHWKSNATNSTTKTNCFPVVECQDSFGSKCKRKGSKVLERGGKRHRSLNDKIRENISNHSPADALMGPVFLQNVNRFLQDPPLHHSFDLYPPIPSPRFPQNRFSGNYTNDVNIRGQKYFRFPLSLCKPECRPIPDDIILRFLAQRPDTEEKMNSLNHENFLSDAYKRTFSRNSYSNYISPSPVNQVSPLDLLTSNQPCDMYTNGCITPPLYHKVSDKHSLESGFITGHNSNQKYCEEVILCNRLNGETHETCSYCKMQIMLPQKTFKWKSHDKESYLPFCSSSCLARLKRQGPNCMTSFVPDASNFDIPFTVTSTIESQPLIILLVKSNHPKRMKQSSKRLSSQDLQVNFKRSPNETSNRMLFGVSSTVKRWRNIRWRRLIGSPPVCSFNVLRSSSDLPMSQKSFLSKKFSCIDTRVCQLCHQIGDGSNDVTSRLLNYNTDKWLHLNCILWCYETYETVSGSLMDVPCSSEKASKTPCTYCKNLGAGLPCFDSDCQAVYHLPCAYQINCSFHPDRGMYCPLHLKSASNIPHLDSLAVERKVYISRDEHSQVEKIISDEDHFTSMQNVKEPKLKLRIGTLILHRIGQLLPEQLASGVFHTSNFIYPVGYWTSRIYWSFRHVGQRCRYDCRIEDSVRPDDVNQSLVDPILVKFTVEVIEPNEEKIFFEDTTCDGVWRKIINRINSSRKCSSLFRILQDNIQGEVLYGLTEPHIIRAIESLPGVDRLSNYLFKFGKLQLIQEMPLAINPTGSARSEPKLRTYIRRKSTGDVNTCTYIAHNHVFLETPGHPYSSDIGSPTYLNSLSPSMTSKSQQYRRLRWDWKTNVVLARSRIQGLGLYAARDISKSTFIIEYLGEVIRNEVANRRERLYESQNRGIYMFRVDDDWIVDATMSGGLARYINHSCDPNCTAEILHCDNSNHIVIIASKNIEKGDELTYDYKFDLEEDRWDRIPCLCGSINCRKWMN